MSTLSVPEDLRLIQAYSWEGCWYYLRGNQAMTSQSILSQTQPGYFQGTPSGCIIPNKRYSSLSQEANITSEILFDFYLLKISVCHLRKAPIKNPLGKDLAKAWAASSLKARSPVIRSSLSFCVLDMATLLSTGASQSRKHNTSARADP